MAEFKEVMKQKERMCDIINCKDCQLCSFNNKLGFPCDDFLSKYPEEAEEIIMNWAKENPIKTNADVFEEVFGIKPNANNYNCPQECCEECLYNNFWDKEYKEV